MLPGEPETPIAPTISSPARIGTPPPTISTFSRNTRCGSGSPLRWSIAFDSTEVRLCALTAVKALRRAPQQMRAAAVTAQQHQELPAPVCYSHGDMVAARLRGLQRGGCCRHCQVDAEVALSEKVCHRAIYLLSRKARTFVT